jgi:hypothetical protein
MAAVQQQLEKVQAAVAAERQQQGVRRLLLQQHLSWAHNRAMEVRDPERGERGVNQALDQ